MTITSQKSAQYTDVTAVPVVNLSTAEIHGRVRMAYFTHTQVGTGDTGSSVALFKLPAGRVRLLLAHSSLYVDWTTASAKMDLGWDAYTGQDGVAVIADPDGLADGIDVDTIGYREGATLATLPAIRLTGGTHLFTSKDGVVIRATAQDNAQVATNDKIAGSMFYVID